MEQQSYLTDLEFNPVLASTEKRFLNYLIDIIIFYITSVIVVVGFFSGAAYLLPDSFASDLLFSLIAMVWFAVLYFLSELIFNGRTIGKFITGTKAVNEDGTQMQPKTILLRSFSRMVPFERFSAFGGHPWHDRWTRTIVIDVRKTALNDPSFE